MIRMAKGELWKSVEIYCAVLPRMAVDANSADRLIAEFLVNQQHRLMGPCSGCAGNCENPDATAAPEVHSQEKKAASPELVEKLSAQQS
jgi:hypothetical protein